MTNTAKAAVMTAAGKDLEIKEYRGASIVKGTGLYGDLSETRILH